MGYSSAKDFELPGPSPAHDERGVYRPAWDGIGNLVALYKDGPEAAMNEYSPYGDGARERGDGRSASRTARRAEEAGALRATTKQLLRSRGPYAQRNPLRCGTKLADPLTDLIDYGIGADGGSFGLGLNRGPLFGGVVFDTGRLVGNFQDTFNILFGD